MLGLSINFAPTPSFTQRQLPAVSKSFDRFSRSLYLSDYHKQFDSSSPGGWRRTFAKCPYKMYGKWRGPKRYRYRVVLP